MAARSFSTSPRSKPPRSIHRFTLEEANRSLPLVRRIVSDVVQTHSVVAAAREAVESAASPKDADVSQKALDAAISRLEELVEELAGVGVEMKDLQSGLVDFVGRHDGRDVYLCWKLGEDQITWWHELGAGFGGRKSVSLLREDPR